MSAAKTLQKTTRAPPASEALLTSHVKWDKLMGYSALGGWMVERYLPSHWVIRGLGSAAVGVLSNMMSWQTAVGCPRKPMIFGGLISAIMSTQNFITLRHPGISGCLTGSTIFSMYFASKHRGTLMTLKEANDAWPFF